MKEVENRFLRTKMLIGEKGLEKLKSSKVAVFGVGGVGSYVVEALARTGVGNFSIFDKDMVDETNINRQIIALSSTVGKNKTEVIKKRVLDINPDIKIDGNIVFYSKENSGLYNFSNYDYIVDAVDTVSSKIEIISNANKSKTKIISCMGTGNKLNPLMLEVSDIYDTSVCPLARIMRRELKRIGIKHLKVVYSKEEPVKIDNDLKQNYKKAVTASISFVPSAAGIIIASEVVKDIIGY